MRVDIKRFLDFSKDWIDSVPRLMSDTILTFQTFMTFMKLFYECIKCSYFLYYSSIVLISCGFDVRDGFLRKLVKPQCKIWFNSLPYNLLIRELTRNRVYSLPKNENLDEKYFNRWSVRLKMSKKNEVV